MATMKLYELVNHYHIGTELTCAEAMFMACNEYYHLNLSEETPAPRRCSWPAMNITI